ncbi:ATP-dependent Clp protease proteolytic subunit [Streptomyces sp. NPDC048352]|uniref:ClpP family protease n=1 Tax=Streptomyces sp. NPDC048352 TaxID=3154718 RepID=UPI00344581FE
MPRSSPTAATRDHVDPIVQRLLRHRILHIGTTINSDTADRITAQMLLLAAETDAPVTLYINSPGGSVPAGLAIYDTMHHIRNDVVTIGLGYCASMAQFLLSAGTSGRRFALPNTRLMLHLPSFAPFTFTGDAENQPEELRYTRHRIAELIARHTHRHPDQVTKDFTDDRWLTPEEAKNYGLIDDVLDTLPHTLKRLNAASDPALTGRGMSNAGLGEHRYRD